jgi:hypothetical protein
VSGVIEALLEGFRRVARCLRLVLAVWLVNVTLAALLVAPLCARLERELRHRDAAVGMLYGFDYGWWSQWSAKRGDGAQGFGPDILGVGFAVKNLDLLLRGQLPARAFSFTVPTSEPRDAQVPVDPTILGMGALYLVLQVFLQGGILGALRPARGSVSARGLLHGSGFYFGRMARVSLLQLLALLLVFGLNAPTSRWADRQAAEAVSEATAMAWQLGRHAALWLAILAVHMVSSYARIVVVVEERASAVLAFLSAIGFCLARPLRTSGHYLTVTLLGGVLLLAWGALDGHFEPTGFRTQLVTLGLAQALITGRIGLRLCLLGGQVALFQAEAGVSVAPQGAGASASNQV